MSRAGKFIPGGTGSKTAKVGGSTSGRTGPIRAPSEPPDESGAGGKPRPFGKGSSLVKPVPKNRRIAITIMSAAVCCLLVWVAQYNFFVLPEARRASAAEARTLQAQKELADALAAQQKKQDELQKQQNAARATVIVDSRPSGAAVTIGDAHKQTPATFNDIPPGVITLLIQSDGYKDYKQEMTVAADKPTDLGIIQLLQQAGSLSLASPQNEVMYTLTGPNGFSRDGQMPDKIQNLPIGDYQLLAWQHDWKLSPITFTIHDQENVQKEIKFPYASVSINSVPPGATVRNGHEIVGQTPLALAQLRPGKLNLSVDLPPYTVQRFVLNVPEFGNVTKTVTLQKDKDFIAACGMVMVWIPDGYWVGKYEVRQNEFTTVAGYNPSTFRRGNRPVETISWDAAMTFCDKLTQYERKEGRLPAGYHYTLPTETQWDAYSADADINQAAMSRDISLSSTQEVGASEPNKYGLYDTLGNVWEWCADEYDDRGNRSLRGGGWLSSADNFPGAETRIGAAPKYTDRFTGFRVVLVPQ